MNFEINRRNALVISGLGIADHGWSQSLAYPIKPIKIIVPTPPGGGADYLARLIGQKLSTRLSQAVLIENRPGAAGDTAAEQVSKMAGDGYTIFIGAIAILALSPFLYKNLPAKIYVKYRPIEIREKIIIGVVGVYFNSKKC